MIECRNLTKKYRSASALSDVSFVLRKGVYGLVGENGAGKTTLFRLLTGQEDAFQGSISIDGEGPGSAKLRMGYLPQKFDFFHNLKVYESLEYIGALKGGCEISRHGAKSRNRRAAGEGRKARMQAEIGYWLRQVSLSPEKGKKVGALSGGMRQRLGIAQAFLGEPEYILLDEPTVGLDPKERLAFRNLVNEEGADKVILISTHILEDVRATCENILVLQKGKLLYQGTTQDFIDSVQDRIYTIRLPRDQLKKFSSVLDIISIKLFGDELEVRIVGREYPVRLPDRKPETCSLEDAYFLTTGMSYQKGEGLRPGSMYFGLRPELSGGTGPGTGAEVFFAGRPDREPGQVPVVEPAGLTDGCGYDRSVEPVSQESGHPGGPAGDCGDPSDGSCLGEKREEGVSGL